MERKVKYSYEFKLSSVQRVLKNQDSVNSISKELCLDTSLLRRWILFYEHHGEKGLLPRKNQDYGVDFKLKVIQTMQSKSLSLIATCLQFNIPTTSTLISWINKYTVEGVESLHPKTRGKPKSMSPKKPIRKQAKPLTREEELLEELKILRLENDYLKKLYALIQKENQPLDKKR